MEKIHENKQRYMCDDSVSIIVYFKDNIISSVTGTIFGSNTPTLVQMNGHVFISPVPLAGKLCFIQLSISEVLGKIGKAQNLKGLYSSGSDKGELTAVSIEEDVDLTKAFQTSDMSVVSL